MCRVSRVSGQCRLRNSACAAVPPVSGRRLDAEALFRGRPAGTGRKTGRACQSRLARRAVAVPMRPQPMMPSVRPRRRGVPKTGSRPSFARARIARRRAAGGGRGPAASGRRGRPPPRCRNRARCRRRCRARPAARRSTLSKPTPQRMMPRQRSAARRWMRSVRRMSWKTSRASASAGAAGHLGLVVGLQQPRSAVGSRTAALDAGFGQVIGDDDEGTLAHAAHAPRITKGR